MSPRIPLELHAELIGFLYHDNAALKSCALVCQTWLPLARHHLFRRIHVHPAELVLFRNLIRQNPRICQYVRKFTLTQASHHAEASDIVEVLQRLDGLESLRCIELFAMCRPLDAAHAVDEILNSIVTMKNLRKLYIGSSIFQTPICGLKYLRDDFLASVTGLSRLETLSVCMQPNEAMYRIYDAIIRARQVSDEKIPTLRHLTVDVIVPYEKAMVIFNRLGPLMLHVGVHLRTLTLTLMLDCTVMRSDNLMSRVCDGLAMGRFISLTSFKIYFRIADGASPSLMFAVAATLLNHIPKTAPLTSLTLVIENFGTVGLLERQPVYAESLQALDDAICHLSRLKEITICQPSSSAQRQLERQRIDEKVLRWVVQHLPQLRNKKGVILTCSVFQS